MPSILPLSLKSDSACSGNCDYMVRGLVEEMLVLGGKRIYLTHGHIYKVKQDLTLLINGEGAWD